MELIAWTPMLSVKVEKMDVQHKKIIKFINRLFRIIEDGEAEEIIQRTIDDLIEYAKSHFLDEEKILKENKYPDYESHLEAHKMLIQQVEDFKVREKKEGLKIKVELFNFLKSWLTSHILGVDKKYSHFLNVNGVN